MGNAGLRASLTLAADHSFAFLLFVETLGDELLEEGLIPLAPTMGESLHPSDGALVEANGDRFGSWPRGGELRVALGAHPREELLAELMRTPEVCLLCLGGKRGDVV